MTDSASDRVNRTFARYATLGVAAAALVRPTRNPVRFSCHFHRHGRACPGHRSWQSAATDGRRKACPRARLRPDPGAGYDGEAGFNQSGWANGRCEPAINPLVVGTQFTTFFLAAIIATFLGGVYAGSLSVALSTLSAWLFIQPHLYSFALAPGASHALIMFAAVGTVMVSALVRCRRPVAPPNKMSFARSR
jgi:hypothetical protein